MPIVWRFTQNHRCNSNFKAKVLVKCKLKIYQSGRYEVAVVSLNKLTFSRCYLKNKNRISCEIVVFNFGLIMDIYVLKVFSLKFTKLCPRLTGMFHGKLISMIHQYHGVSKVLYSIKTVLIWFSCFIAF